MRLHIDDYGIEPRTGERLKDLIDRLGLDTDDMKSKPLAAKIAGEVFNLNYIPVR